VSAVVIDTPTGIARYQAIVVRQGLKACKIGLRVNRAYTPKNLIAMTTKITGQKFAARDYDGAIAALTTYIEEVSE
jgi:hypothetical protein